MSQFTLRGYRRWWIFAAILSVVVIAAVPAASIVQHMVDNAVGRTTVATDADGTGRTVSWREYPGVAGIDPQQVLDGPTPQQGLDAGQTMIAEIKAALSEELQLEWAPVGATAGSSPFHRPRLTPDKQVIVSGVAPGRAGQWLSFRFQDLSKDTDGAFEERLRPPDGSQWQMNTLALSYGANGLLAAEDRYEFKSRIEPFRGLIPPEPLES